MKKLLKIIVGIAIVLSIGMVSFVQAKITIPETIRVKTNDGSILTLSLDEYLYGVVSSEMGTSYKADGKIQEVGIEALKAQAVASRSFAIYNMQHAKYDGYDISTTTSDQVYKAGDVKDIVKEAVDSTSGQVLICNNAIISAYFFSTSGGHTESSENVWTATLPYAKGVDDPYEPYIEGKSEWEVRIPRSQYGTLEILEKSENDRVIKMKIGNETYTNSNIRAKLGNTFVKSTWFELAYDEDADEYVLTGKGYGHGVGMSQYGAMGMAAKGFSYEEILKWYYTDVALYPANEDYIVVNPSSKVTEIKKEEDVKEIEVIDVVIKTSEKEYRESKPTTIQTVQIPKENETTSETLLQRILNAIESWR